MIFWFEGRRRTQKRVELCMPEQWRASINLELEGERNDVEAGKMRFLAVQENGYGVSAAQERVPDDARDESVMAATGETEPDGLPRVEAGSMISNLPLLFANGYPTSLDKISVKQLERFITFMVQCSLGHDTAEVISEPQWWPKEVKFSNPLVRPKKTNDSWMANLKKLVFRCYTYHRSEYLLRFCSYLAQYPHDKLYYVNNWDSTTSLYHKSSGKLLVTFRNENMNYDKVAESPRRSLLPQHSSSSNSINKSKQPQQQQQSQSLVMIQPPSDEIYLCDNCDAEFVGLEKMKAHEKTCGEPTQTGSVSRPQTPCEVPVDSELAQNQFLEYFSLYSDGPPRKPATSSTSDASTFSNVALLPGSRGSRRVRASVNLTRCPTIPFSSPAGLAMAKKSKVMTEVTQQERLERIERHLHAPALGKSVRPKWLDRVVEYNRWCVSYKPNRDRTAASGEDGQQPQEQHVHEYKFNSRTGRPVLDLRSQLLYIACKPLRILLTRLTPTRIEELKRDSTKYRPPYRRVTPRTRPRPLSKARQVVYRSATLKRKSSDEVQLKRKLSDEEQLGGELSNELQLKLPHLLEVTVEKLPSAEGHLSKPLQKLDELAEITVIREPPVSVKQRVQNSSPSSTTSPAPPGGKILIVDLCSSDEESENAAPGSSDENRDPMRAKSNFSRVVALGGKFRAKPFVFPADSTGDWLRDSVLTDENDKCGAKKCSLTSVVLENCILKPEP